MLGLLQIDPCSVDWVKQVFIRLITVVSAARTVQRIHFVLCRCLRLRPLITWRSNFRECDKAAGWWKTAVAVLSDNYMPMCSLATHAFRTDSFTSDKS